MASHAASCPMTYRQAVETYFMEHRAKLLDVAAFFDRIERTTDRGQVDEDYRVTALRSAIALLGDGKGDYARRLLDHFSDPTEALIPKAGEKGASGVYPGPAA